MRDCRGAPYLNVDVVQTCEPITDYGGVIQFCFYKWQNGCLSVQLAGRAVDYPLKQDPKHFNADRIHIAGRIPQAVIPYIF